MKAALSQLGLTSWMRHSPILLGDQACLYFDKQFLLARCLVVLPIDGLSSPPNLSVAGEKVFSGMIKVLELQDAEIIYLRVAYRTLTPEIVQQTKALIHLLEPQHVLDFSRSATFKIDDTYHRTFHPEQLVKKPEQKKMAYQDLLAVKTILEGKND